MFLKQNKKRKIPTIFGRLHLKDFNDNNENNNSFHELLDNYADKIVKEVEKNKDFKEIVPDIKKGKRMNFLYKRLVYKGMKYQSPFMKALIKMIKKSEAKNKIEVEKKEYKELYKLSPLDIIKLKKKKWERFQKINLKDLNIKKENQNSTKSLVRSFSNFNSYMTSKTPKFNLNSSLNDSNYSFNNNSNYKNFGMTNRFSKNSSNSPNSKELSTYYLSDTNFKNLSFNTLNLFTPKNNKATYLIDKCLEEIDSGNNLSENINKVNQSYSKDIKKRYQTMKFMTKTRTFNLDIKGIKKYKKLELNNINEIKRKINEKISPSFAFQNCKKFKQKMKNAESTSAYYIYLHDMQKTNEKLEKQRSVERKKMKKVENLCEDEFKKKEYLKKRIDFFNRRHKNEKKIQNIIANNEFWLTNKRNDDEYNKNINEGFLPTLFRLREQALKEITICNSVNEKEKMKIYG